ncbi:MAG: DUF6788 family protein [Acidimicrobiales bacterium]
MARHVPRDADHRIAKRSQIAGKARHGPYYQWSRAVAGKTVSRRLSQAEAELYRERIANRQELERIVAEMEQVSTAARKILLRQVSAPDIPTRASP